MPKTFITPAYTFTPGASGVGTVTLLGLAAFDVRRLVAIINQTRGVVIYSTGSAAARYTAVAGSTLTLFFDTSTHDPADVLQVIYEDPATPLPDGAATDSMLAMLSRLVKISESSATVDQFQRQRVTVDAFSALASLPSVTAVANLTATAGMDREQWINVAKATYFQSIRSQLTFS
jgi:hypothetical protein